MLQFLSLLSEWSKNGKRSNTKRKHCCTSFKIVCVLFYRLQDCCEAFYEGTRNPRLLEREMRHNTVQEHRKNGGGVRTKMRYFHREENLVLFLISSFPFVRLYVCFVCLLFFGHLRSKELCSRTRCYNLRGVVNE